jgi:hypothetical protein
VIPRYVINFDEFISTLDGDISSLISRGIRDKYPQITSNNIESVLEDIKKLMPSEAYKKMKNSMDLIIGMTKLDGIQKIDGRLIDVPPIVKILTETFIFEKDVYLTGLHVNQTGWKKEDVYNLEIDKKYLIKDSPTKEVGEHKYLNTYFLVTAKTPINFTLNNKSGNSRQTMIDLEYLERKEITPPPIPNPNVPDISNISNAWDIAVLMNWESNSAADIDLHGFIGDMHVWYGNPSEDNFYLNFDTQSHLNNNNPEILSVKGYKNEILNVYVHNYNSTNLSDPINIKIYGKDIAGARMFKEFNISLESSNAYLLGVCSIDLNTLTINELNNKKTF